MAKASKNMPQFKRSRFLFLCLNERPKFRNDLTITKWIPLLSEVVSTQSPHHPYPCAGVDGLCGRSERVIGLGEFYFDDLLPSTLFQLCSLHYHANSYAVSNETANRMGYGEKGLFKLGITPEKLFYEPMAIEDMFISAGWFGDKLKINSYRSLKSLCFHF